MYHCIRASFLHKLYAYFIFFRSSVLVPCRYRQIKFRENLPRLLWKGRFFFYICSCSGSGEFENRNDWCQIKAAGHAFLFLYPVSIKIGMFWSLAYQIFGFPCLSSVISRSVTSPAAEYVIRTIYDDAIKNDMQVVWYWLLWESRCYHNFFRKPEWCLVSDSY